MSLGISFPPYVQYIEMIMTLLAALGPVVTLHSMMTDQAISPRRLQLARVERSAASRLAVSPQG